MIRRKGLVGYVEVIHPSAWEGNSRKSACSILYRLALLPLRTPSDLKE